MSSNSTSTGSANADIESAGFKAAITCIVLGVAFLLSVVIARLVDMCYDRRALADDASDISESTRQIIRARLSVIQFRKKEIKAANSKSALDVIRKWVTMFKDRQQSRQEVLSSNRLPGHAKDLNLSREDIIENGVPGEQGGQKTPRNPFFIGPKNVVVPSRPPTREARPLSSVRIVSASLHPVQKGQPVSSQQQIMPNILLANADKPIKKPPPLILKAVHFDDDSGQKKTDEVTTSNTGDDSDDTDS